MDKSYQDLFFSEAEEYLREVNQALVSLEKNTDDKDAINTIFRHMHTLKGMAATVGYMDLAKFAHRLEDIFDIIRGGKSKLNTVDIDILFESIDALAGFVNDLKENISSSINIALYLDKLDTIGSAPPTLEEERASPSKKRLTLDETLRQKYKLEGKKVFKIAITLTSDCPMKGARAFLIVQRLRSMGILIALFPEESIFNTEGFDGNFECILAGNLSKKNIHHELSNITEIERAHISIFETEPRQKPGALEKLKPVITPIVKHKIQSIRISTDKLDRVMNLVGELVIAKNRFSQTVYNKDYLHLDETCYLVEQLVSSLQDEVLKMRLLPISYITDHFPRFVRDTAKAAGKDVSLKISGGDVELDRVILDELVDLLMHLIKNAIDHGIESPDQRVRCDKNTQGNILINIFREKGYVTIVIQDDGAGIDQELILKKALEKNILSPQEAEDFNPDRITDILTTPGFTTKEEITELSGRGVGLDVVKNRLDSVGGNLKLETEKGKGTIFSLTVPLSLAIIKAMLVMCGGETYAIPLMSVRETVHIKRKDIKTVGKGDIIVIREEVIPFLELNNLLKSKNSYQKNSENLLTVITERGNKSVGFAVDKIIGEQDLVVKPLGSFFKNIKVKGITGATILGNGRVALILDMLNLLDYRDKL